ncbi:hypothetical protein CCACVL1_02291 [Corchorus capsularis]|uniref:Uncharacterized protein n=1 Tax=Corchorus capsularis TaxID=210143 RepID=A0A1R3K9H4_COCAP|nr:hypothetical protein CCACVL1_02291 [Corchorus capsularis]
MADQLTSSTNRRLFTTTQHKPLYRFLWNKTQNPKFLKQTEPLENDRGIDTINGKIGYPVLL